MKLLLLALTALLTTCGTPKYNYTKPHKTVFWQITPIDEHEHTLEEILYNYQH